MGGWGLPFFPRSLTRNLRVASSSRFHANLFENFAIVALLGSLVTISSPLLRGLWQPCRFAGYDRVLIVHSCAFCRNGRERSRQMVNPGAQSVHMVDNSADKRVEIGWVVEFK